MAYEALLIEIEDQVGVIKLNRPDALNAFNNQLMDELTAAVDEFEANPDIGCIVITGSSKAFAAGADIKEMQAQTYMTAYCEDFITRNWERVSRCRKPVIAAVAGYALGGGCELAMMCDFILAGENAKFGQTGPKVGSFDGGWGASYMARIIGQKRAREVWYLCRFYNAEKALDWGLVNAVVPFKDLENETIQWCREILTKSPTAIRLLKASLNADCDGQAGLQQLAGDATLLFYQTEEAQEGRDAFKEKRDPDFGKYPRFP